MASSSVSSRRTPLATLALRACWLPLVALSPACSDAGSAAPEKTDAHSVLIVDGEVDREHSSVFLLVAEVGEAYGACTATLIAPNLLLTARHCVSRSAEEFVVCGRAELSEPYAAHDLHAANPARLNEDVRWFQGAAVHVPTEGADTCGFDVALIELTENVPAAMAVLAVPRIDRPVEQGESYSAVGYGLNEDESTGGRMLLRDQTVRCSPGACGRSVKTTEFVGASGVCQGDSGGPAFDGAGKLVGVVSRGTEQCGSPVYGTVTAWRDLIIDAAFQAAARGGYDPPFWARSGVSDPPVVIGIGQPCDETVECAEGSVCGEARGYSVPSCLALCSKDDECASPLSCRPLDEARRVCAEPDEAGPSDGGSAESADGPAPSCSVGAPPRATQGAPWVAAGVGLLLLGVRRRRHPVAS